jgi:hypothetical protein
VGVGDDGRQQRPVEQIPREGHVVVVGVGQRLGCRQGVTSVSFEMMMMMMVMVMVMMMMMMMMMMMIMIIIIMMVMMTMRRFASSFLETHRYDLIFMHPPGLTDEILEPT